ncbi:unnamed protein product, partial [Ectocarpus fasciculatus]
LEKISVGGFFCSVVGRRHREPGPRVCPQTHRQDGALRRRQVEAGHGRSRGYPQDLRHRFPRQPPNRDHSVSRRRGHTKGVPSSLEGEVGQGPQHRLDGVGGRFCKGVGCSERGEDSEGAGGGGGDGPGDVVG